MGTRTLHVTLGVRFMDSFPHQKIRFMDSSWSLGSSVRTYRKLHIPSLTPSRQTRLLCKVFTATWEARAAVTARSCLVLAVLHSPDAASVLILQPTTRSRYTPGGTHCLALLPLGFSGRAGSICLWSVIVLLPQRHPWDAVKYQRKFAVADFLLWRISTESCQNTHCSLCSHSLSLRTPPLTEPPNSNNSGWVKELSFDP